jgi:hypothetical protein
LAQVAVEGQAIILVHLEAMTLLEFATERLLPLTAERFRDLREKLTFFLFDVMVDELLEHRASKIKVGLPEPLLGQKQSELDDAVLHQCFSKQLRHPQLRLACRVEYFSFYPVMSYEVGRDFVEDSPFCAVVLCSLDASKEFFELPMLCLQKLRGRY